jgi:hydrogenase expression/formation protein HypC
MCVGIPGRVTEIVDAEHRIATVDVGGIRRKINLACIVDQEHPVESCVGEWVLIHVGFAMSRIDEKEAQETLKLLEELGEADRELEAMQQSPSTQ